MSKLAVVGVVLSLSATAAAREDAAASRSPAAATSPTGRLNADWQRWSRETMPIAPDGVDFSRIKKLAASEPATAERMLRLGLSLCDPIAAQAVTVTKLRGLLPELKALLSSPPGAGGGGGLVRAVGATGRAGGAAPRSASTSCARRTRSIPPRTGRRTWCRCCRTGIATSA